MLAKVKPQGLQNLQSFGAPAVRIHDQVRLHARIVRIGRQAPGRLGEDYETARMGGLQLIDRVLQIFTIAAGQVHHGPDVLAVHHRQAGLRTGRKPDASRPL